MSEAATAITKSATELRQEYESLAAECSRLAAAMPKQRKALEDQIRKDAAKGMKDFERKFAEKRAAKHAAFVAWEAAEAAEKK